MQILVVTDAWSPQVNGVVQTLSTLRSILDRDGHTVTVLAPDRFRSVACPTYPEIRLALAMPAAVSSIIEAVRPDAIHIATEGPLGYCARYVCRRRDYPFTTSLHTRFPEYVRARLGVPLSWGYGVLRRFHRPAVRVMVSTPTLERELIQRGFANLVRWSRGVDTDLFRPRDKRFLDLPRPVSLFVGRVAIEKNIEAFLSLSLPGTKVVIGDGPQLPALRQRHPDAVFLGVKTGEDLARHYAAADVFVFPSRTDTFGLVMLEALASGVPVAAFPVPGPLDVVDGSGAACLDEDLSAAVHAALRIPPERCREHAQRFSWENCARQFLGNLEVFR